MATAFVPVRLGKIVFDQPYKLAAAIQEPAIQALLQTYFPAIGQPTPIRSIPEDDLDMLENALITRRKSIGSIPQQRLSTINGMKTRDLVIEMTKIISEMQSRGVAPGAVADSKKTLTRRRFNRLKPEDKRKIIFKLLWDLFHNTQEGEVVNKSWDEILANIISKPGYQIILEAMENKNPLPSINLRGLEAGKEEDGLKQFTMAAAKSSSDKITNLYVICETFAIDFNKLTADHKEFLKKMSSVLNVFVEFYMSRMNVIDTIDEIISGFFNSVKNVDLKLEDSLLLLYKTITGVVRDKNKEILENIIDKTNDGVLIKLAGMKQEELKLFVQSYYKYFTTRRPQELLTKDGSTQVTNALIEEDKGKDRAKNLFTLNLTDTFLIQIITPESIKNTVNEIPETYKTSGINEEGVKKEVNDFFKNNQDIFIYVNRSSKARNKLARKNWVAKLYTYKDGTLADAVPSLKDKSCITPTDKKYIDITFDQPKEIFSSFTLATLQLFLLLHIYKKVGVLGPKNKIPYKRTKAE